MAARKCSIPGELTHRSRSVLILDGVLDESRFSGQTVKPLEADF